MPNAKLLASFIEKGVVMERMLACGPPPSPAPQSKVSAAAMMGFPASPHPPTPAVLDPKREAGANCEPRRSVVHEGAAQHDVMAGTPGIYPDKKVSISNDHQGNSQKLLPTFQASATLPSFPECEHKNGNANAIENNMNRCGLQENKVCCQPQPPLQPDDHRSDEFMYRFQGDSSFSLHTNFATTTTLTTAATGVASNNQGREGLQQCKYNHSNTAHNGPHLCENSTPPNSTPSNAISQNNSTKIQMYDTTHPPLATWHCTEQQAVTPNNTLRSGAASIVAVRRMMQLNNDRGGCSSNNIAPQQQQQPPAAISCCDSATKINNGKETKHHDVNGPEASSAASSLQTSSPPSQIEATHVSDSANSTHQQQQDTRDHHEKKSCGVVEIQHNFQQLYKRHVPPVQIELRQNQQCAINPNCVVPSQDSCCVAGGAPANSSGEIVQDKLNIHQLSPTSSSLSTSASSLPLPSPAALSLPSAIKTLFTLRKPTDQNGLRDMQRIDLSWHGFYYRDEDEEEGALVGGDEQSGDSGIAAAAKKKRGKDLDEAETTAIVDDAFLPLFAREPPRISVEDYLDRLMSGMGCSAECYIIALCLVFKVSRRQGPAKRLGIRRIPNVNTNTCERKEGALTAAPATKISPPPNHAMFVPAASLSSSSLPSPSPAPTPLPPALVSPLAPEGYYFAHRAFRPDLPVTIPVTTRSIHRLLLVGLVTAVKMRDDKYFSLRHYARIGGVEPNDLMRMEVVFMRLLGFDATVRPEHYCDMVYSIRHHSSMLYHVEGFAWALQAWADVIRQIPIPTLEGMQREMTVEAEAEGATAADISLPSPSRLLTEEAHASRSAHDRPMSKTDVEAHTCTDDVVDATTRTEVSRPTASPAKPVHVDADFDSLREGQQHQPPPASTLHSGKEKEASGGIRRIHRHHHHQHQHQQHLSNDEVSVAVARNLSNPSHPVLVDAVHHPNNNNNPDNKGNPRALLLPPLPSTDDADDIGSVSNAGGAIDSPPLTAARAAGEGPERPSRDQLRRGSSECNSVNNHSQTASNNMSNSQQQQPPRFLSLFGDADGPYQPRTTSMLMMGGGGGGGGGSSDAHGSGTQHSAEGSSVPRGAFFVCVTHTPTLDLAANGSGGGASSGSRGGSRDDQTADQSEAPRACYAPAACHFLHPNNNSFNNAAAFPSHPMASLSSAAALVVEVHSAAEKAELAGPTRTAHPFVSQRSQQALRSVLDARDAQQQQQQQHPPPPLLPTLHAIGGGGGLTRMSAAMAAAFEMDNSGMTRTPGSSNSSTSFNPSASNNNNNNNSRSGGKGGGEGTNRSGRSPRDCHQEYETGDNNTNNKTDINSNSITHNSSSNTNTVTNNTVNVGISGKWRRDLVERIGANVAARRAAGEEDVVVSSSWTANERAHTSHHSPSDDARPTTATMDGARAFPPPPPPPTVNGGDGHHNVPFFSFGASASLSNSLHHRNVFMSPPQGGHPNQ